ncbi:MAG TPA: NAD(P)/FAD-dependent oxidoreductase [Rugosimonospora sp.]|nr:NAD(P)/FAD-dependent oxidoreductase [Rugosimonospora sp.]
MAVVGAGFGGIATGARLKQAGEHNFVILERNARPGGTWHVNTYPGAQCDIPSILYSFSFAPNPNWTRLYPTQDEIAAYLRDCVTRFGLSEHIHCNQDVTAMVWDGTGQRWRVSTAGGTWTADVLVLATGPFSEPAIPDIPGLDRFGGTVFHSAAWRHDHDLRGERVAVIGTGASAVQFIPRIQPQVAHLTVFQRTPTWILPHPDRTVPGPVRALFHRVPATQRGLRWLINLAHECLVPGMVRRPDLLRPLAALGRRHLNRRVKEPALRRALTPTYAFGCKRPTFSNRYFPALTQPNVTLETDTIAEATATGIRTASGTEHTLDTIVLATGFRLSRNEGFHRIIGRHGRSLADTWNGGTEMSAYLGTTISGFPNLYMILGPNCVVYTSQIVTIEAQVDYIIDALRVMRERRLSNLEVTGEAQQHFREKVDRGLATSVWNTGGCRSYYLSPTGRNYAFWPGTAASFRRTMRNLRLEDYHAHAAERVRA